MTKIRIGFVGVGNMGQAAHLQNYVALPDAQVVAIAEIRPNLGHEVAARYGIPKVYSGHEELLANEPLDAIVAIQAFGSHIDLVPKLLEKGVPLLTEKPLAESLENGQRLAAAAEKAKAPYYLAYHKRSDPASEYARRQVEQWKQSGAVGRLRYIRMTMPPGDWIAAGFWQNVKTEEKYDAKWGMDSRYGSFVNYYIHQVNLLRFLIGEDYQIIFADPYRQTFTGRTADGVTLLLEMQPYANTIDWQESALIGFDKGSIHLELPAPLTINRAGRVTIQEDPGNGVTPRIIIPTLPWIHAMRQQAANFVKAVNGEPTTLCTAQEGLKDLQLAARYTELLEESEQKFKADIN